MNINVEVKIKMDKGKEIVLKNEEAKELYIKLKELYDKETTYVPYPYYPYIVYEYKQPFWTTTDGSCSLTYSCNSNI